MILLMFIPQVRINNIPVLVQILFGADQATNQYLNLWWLVYWHIYDSLGINELKPWIEIIYDIFDGWNRTTSYAVRCMDIAFFWEQEFVNK